MSVAQVPAADSRMSHAVPVAVVAPGAAEGLVAVR